MLKLKPDTRHDVVFLLDVDNTLLDNDRFKADLDQRLLRDFGAGGRQRYWNAYEGQRARLGYADYLAALQAFREGLDDNPDLLQLSAFMLDYPFAQCLYPGALATILNLHALGTPVVLSDGDVVFQPRKVQRSGVWDAVHGRVLIYLHKEHMLDAVQRRFPAQHYGMVDDKPKLLAAMKVVMGERLTTIFVRQGHYAAQAECQSIIPPPDLVIGQIGELAEFDLRAFGLDRLALRRLDRQHPVVTASPSASNSQEPPP